MNKPLSAPETSEKIYLLTGSNLGQREQQLMQAQEFIANHIGRVSRASSIYETEAWGLTDQPSFFNQVLEVHTTASPAETMQQILHIEEAMGRERKQKWAARTIDIDILFFGSQIIDQTDLQIPHPFLQERRFTLEPLVELAPAFKHPTFGLTTQQLLDNCTDPLKVYKLTYSE